MNQCTTGAVIVHRYLLCLRCRWYAFSKFELDMLFVVYALHLLLRIGNITVRVSIIGTCTVIAEVFLLH